MVKRKKKRRGRGERGEKNKREPMDSRLPEDEAQGKSVAWQVWMTQRGGTGGRHAEKERGGRSRERLKVHKQKTTFQ